MNTNETIVGHVELTNPPPKFFEEDVSQTRPTGSESAENDSEEPKALSQYFYTPKTRELIPNTSVTTLKAATNRLELIEALIKYRKCKKLESAFTTAMKDWVNENTGEFIDGSL